MAEAYVQCWHQNVFAWCNKILMERRSWPAHLQLIKRILCIANLVQCYAKVTSQHTGALVDVQAAPEMVLCHLILLLPEVYLAHTIPEEDILMSLCRRPYVTTHYA